MTQAQRGILMLTCPLGEDAEVLSPRQFYGFRRRMLSAERLLHSDEELTVFHLTQLGLPMPTAQKILALLQRETQLDRYLEQCAAYGITPVTRVCGAYPDRLEEKLGNLAPPVLFCCGDVSLLNTPCVALVGSRRLNDRGAHCAETVGRLAAQEGYTLVSGGAVGADLTAQTACLEHGGNVIVFTPGSMTGERQSDHVLYCSETGYDLPFTAQRALNRNRLIHSLAAKTFVAQCDGERGGTWKGSMDNLKSGYSELYVFSDGGAGAENLLGNGAEELQELTSITGLSGQQMKF